MTTDKNILLAALENVDNGQQPLGSLLAPLATLGVSAQSDTDLDGSERLVLGAAWLDGTNAAFEYSVYLWVDGDGDLAAQQHNSGSVGPCFGAEDVMDLLSETVLEWVALHPSKCEDLDALHKSALRFGGDYEQAGIDISDLPVFGGEEPADTDGVWSWDATRLLADDGDGGYILTSR